MPVLRRLGPLGALAGIVVLGAGIPLLFVAASSLELGWSQWIGLWNSRLPGLLWNTLSLAVLVAIGSFALGVSAAWWTTRYDFRGRRLALWLMLLPLTVPTYVFAHIYTVLLQEEGWLGRVWHAVLGADAPLPDLYNVYGATFILSLAGFSYVFLLVRSALAFSHRNLEEAARMQGASRWTTFWRINLPLLRPAIAAGLALVVLHVLSDFGAVSMLRYQTFTLAIYLQMSGRFDYSAAAGLSLVLVFLSLTFLVVERFFRSRQRYFTGAQTRPIELKRAGAAQQLLIWSWLGLISLFAFGLPLAWMLTWSWEAWLQGLIDREFWGYVGNSLTVAVLAASGALIAAFPVAYYHARGHRVLGKVYLQMSSVGFVLPGPVIALGILAFVLATMPILYGSLLALVLALVIRFLPLAVQSQDASIQQLTPSLEQVGRVLGAGPLENLWRITLPVIRSGMAAAWVLVFIDALKELPATLLLRPTGFDTLPVRIWIEASEEMLELAAPAALMLVIGTLPVLWIMLRNAARAADTPE